MDEHYALLTPRMIRNREAVIVGGSGDVICLSQDGTPPACGCIYEACTCITGKSVTAYTSELVVGVEGEPLLLQVVACQGGVGVETPFVSSVSVVVVTIQPVPTTPVLATAPVSGLVPGEVLWGASVAVTSDNSDYICVRTHDLGAAPAADTELCPKHSSHTFTCMLGSPVSAFIATRDVSVAAQGCSFCGTSGKVHVESFFVNECPEVPPYPPPTHHVPPTPYSSGGHLHSTQHSVRCFVDDMKNRSIHTFSHKSQEEHVPRGVSKVSPWFEFAESIFGPGLTQFHGFTRVLSDQPKPPCLDRNWDSVILRKEHRYIS